MTALAATADMTLEAAAGGLRIMIYDKTDVRGWSEELKKYIHAGYETFILDIPASREALGHIGKVFLRATN